MNRLLNEIISLQSGIAWLLANIPPALDEPLRSNAQRMLEDLIIKHGQLQGKAIADDGQAIHVDGPTLVVFGDAKTLDEIEARFREFVAETIVDHGEDEIIEEMVEAGVRNLEAEGDTVEDVNANDLPPEDCWSHGPATEVVEKPFEEPEPGDPPITDRVTEGVFRIISEQLGPATVTRDTRPVGDLNADSLDMVELVIFLEEEFGITIPDSDADDLGTVGQIIDYIAAKA